MKYVRFAVAGREAWGLVDGGRVRLLEGEIFGEPRESGQEFRFADVKLLPPAIPTKIVCLGMNYASHAKEIGLPVPADRRCS